MKDEIGVRRFFLTVCCLLLLAGCATVDTTAYRTVGTTAVAVDGAMQGWGDWVRAGHATAADEAAVQDSYEIYQAVMRSVSQVTTLYQAGEATEAQLTSVLALLSQQATQVIETVKRIREGRR